MPSSASCVLYEVVENYFLGNIMSFKKMSVGLAAHLKKKTKGEFDGFSRLNFNRVHHVVALSGEKLLELFSFVEDNASSEISRVQRNTKLRYENINESAHLRGPLEERPLPQTAFQATWRKDLKQLRLQNGNTRVYEALKNPGRGYFPEVTLEIFEVASADEEKEIYMCYDSRQTLKRGKHEVQSLFRSAGLLGQFQSKRMASAIDLVTPLKSLTAKQKFEQVTSDDLERAAETLLWVDSLMSVTETKERKAGKYAKTVFGGGELAGLMLFLSEKQHSARGQKFLAVLFTGLCHTLKAAFDAKNVYAPEVGEADPVIGPFFVDYHKRVSHISRTGSSKDLQNAFKEALEELFQDWIGQGDAPTPVAIAKRKMR